MSENMAAREHLKNKRVKNGNVANLSRRFNTVYLQKYVFKKFFMTKIQFYENDKALFKSFINILWLIRG